jgi:rubrerythrin
MLPSDLGIEEPIYFYCEVCEKGFFGDENSKECPFCKEPIR